MLTMHTKNCIIYHWDILHWVNEYIYRNKILYLLKIYFIENEN